MLREIVEQTLSTDTEIALVGAVETRDALDAVVRDTPVDVVLVALPTDDEDESYSRLLFAAPRTTLLAITNDGRGAYLYALRPHKAPIEDVSGRGILDAIHDACRLAV